MQPKPFPSIRGESLAGRAYRIPEELPGRHRLLLLAFHERQQREVDTWLAVVPEITTDHDGFRYYELPILATPFRLIRWVIDGGMRSGIADPAARARTITVYLHRRRFLAAAGIPDTSAIRAMLLDRKGRIAWRVEGPATRAKIRSLRKALAGTP